MDTSNVGSVTAPGITKKHEVGTGEEEIGVRLIDMGKTVASKVRSNEDIARESLEKYYNSDMETVRIFLSAVFTDKGNKITYASETSRRQLNDFVMNDFPALRTFEWFLTNYCDKHNTQYFLDKGEDSKGRKKIEHFFVHRAYKSMLDSYKKSFFDPFSRKGKVIMVDPFGNRVKTTLGQLNFFKWQVRNRVVYYVIEHREAIEADLRQSKVDKKKARVAKASGAKMEIKASKRVTVHDVTIVVDFPK